jgi:hypothetical protein
MTILKTQMKIRNSSHFFLGQFFYTQPILSVKDQDSSFNFLDLVVDQSSVTNLNNFEDLKSMKGNWQWKISELQPKIDRGT